MKKGWLIAASLFALSGCVMALGFTPMKFTGILLICAAIFLLLWGFLSKRREQRSVRIIRRILLVILAVGVITFAALEAMVISYGHTDEDTPVSAAIVLGAGVNGTVPSLSLRVRLEAALAYVEGRPDIPIVVSGGRGPGEHITEAECMAGWLTAHGVASDRILLEEKAENTRENIDYSLEILEEHGIDTTASIAVVSSDYHLRRAALYFGSPGMVPVAAHMPKNYSYLTINYYIREAFALGKAMLLP